MSTTTNEKIRLAKSFIDFLIEKYADDSMNNFVYGFDQIQGYYISYLKKHKLIDEQDNFCRRAEFSQLMTVYEREMGSTFQLFNRYHKGSFQFTKLGILAVKNLRRQQIIKEHQDAVKTELVTKPEIFLLLNTETKTYEEFRTAPEVEEYVNKFKGNVANLKICSSNLLELSTKQVVTHSLVIPNRKPEMQGML